MPITSITTNYSTDNTLSSVGNYRIFSYDGWFEYAQAIIGFNDQVSGENGNSVYVQRSFRWSRDGSKWSLWTDFSLTDALPLTSAPADPDKKFYIEFKYTATSSPTADPTYDKGDEVSPSIEIESIEIQVDFKEQDAFKDSKPINGLCSDEFCVQPVLFSAGSTFDPYAVNKAVCLYKDLSKMVNQKFGHDTTYFRVSAQQRSKDVVLKEYTLFNVVSEKCIKILVPNNEFPDSKPNFSNFAMEFEQPFEVHVDRTYWEGFYGKNSMPQKRDIVYFPLNNRLYEVQSSYLYRDFMQQGLYFKMLLVKYQPKADTILPEDIGETLNDLTITTEELFGEEVKDEIERITKPQQYKTTTVDQDPSRDALHKELRIVRYDFYNNWTLISEHYYDMNSLFASKGAVEAVRYKVKSSLALDGSFGLTCWIQPEANTRNTSKTRNLLSGIDQLGNGASVDLELTPGTASDTKVLVKIGSTTHTFNVGIDLSTEVWYGIVVNYSNEFSQVGASIWKMKANTTELDNVYSAVQSVTAAAFTSSVNWSVKASPVLLTNVRLFEEMIPEEDQSSVLNQMIVKDSHKALIIDNSKPRMKLPRIVNPK